LENLRHPKVILKLTDLYEGPGLISIKSEIDVIDLCLLSFDDFFFLKICLNGKCVTEHENSVDYEGPGFLRRSGLADVKSVDDDIQDTPAEPSNAR
jgi:hypothetical protein